MTTTKTTMMLVEDVGKAVAEEAGGEEALGGGDGKKVCCHTGLKRLRALGMPKTESFNQQICIHSMRSSLDLLMLSPKCHWVRNGIMIIAAGIDTAHKCFVIILHQSI
ncbi:hypothetical protein niasHS_014470 [Heterodera schachtii]|uniref:Uncharacterized protein n=1 Tax=Heterodera schachtii TaxID=97005 RepID=A0ABD2IFE7_HETSC